MVCSYSILIKLLVAVVNFNFKNARENSSVSILVQNLRSLYTKHTLGQAFFSGMEVIRNDQSDCSLFQEAEFKQILL